MMNNGDASIQMFSQGSSSSTAYVNAQGSSCTPTANTRENRCLKAPEALIINDDDLYIADSGDTNNGGTIIKVSQTSGTTVTFAGSGTCSSATFSDYPYDATSYDLCQPTNIAIDPSTSNLFISDEGRYEILIIIAATGDLYQLSKGSSSLMYRGLVYANNDLYLNEIQPQVQLMKLNSTEIQQMIDNNSTSLKSPTFVTSLGNIQNVNSMTKDPSRNVIVMCKCIRCVVLSTSRAFIIIFITIHLMVVPLG